MPQQGKRTKNQQLLMALACGATLENAARQCGLSDSTTRRRLQEPAFRQQLQELRADMLQRAAGVLTAAATEAVKTLVILQNPVTPAAVRLGAARAVLELGVKLREAADLEQRLASLEQQMAETQAGCYGGAP